MKTRHTQIIPGIALTFAAVLTAQAQLIYTSGHADIGVGFEDGDFEPHWHVGAGATVDGSELLTGEEYAPAELIAQVSATRNSPSGLAAGIGVTDGSLIYTAGSAGYQPNLGFATEELNASDWLGDITLTLTGWTAPSGSNFSIYSTNFSGTSVVDIVFSSFDSSVTFDSNSLPMFPGDHVHYDWGFTDLGIYDLEFTWSGEHATLGTISITENFSLQVVPEPAETAAIFLVVASFAAVIHRRRQVGSRAVSA